MEPFGVLEWDILEREEEIYESDDVAVEFKVMHALWVRWITLNRWDFFTSSPYIVSDFSILGRNSYRTTIKALLRSLICTGG